MTLGRRAEPARTTVDRPRQVASDDRAHRDAFILLCPVQVRQQRDCLLDPDQAEQEQ